MPADGTNVPTSRPKEMLSKNDRMIGEYAQRMIREGRRGLLFDTFGSEAFWGEVR